MALQAFCAENGAPEEVYEYLAARGFTVVKFFAKAARDDDDFESSIVDPFVQGCKLADVDFQFSGDPAFGRAVLRSLWADARQAMEPPPQPAPQQPPPDGAAAASASQVSGPMKPPKELRKGAWTELVRKYETSFVPERPFPQNQLLGAEVVLAGILLEIDESMQFTPLGLGEILQHRAFTSQMLVNPFMQNACKARALGVSTASGEPALTVTDTKFLPNSQFALLDGLEATKWALIWAQYGNEADLEPWFEYFKKQVRLRGNVLDMVRSLYDACAWRVALAMRGGSKWREASIEVLADSQWIRDYMEHFQPRKPDGQVTDRQGGAGGMKGSGKYDQGATSWGKGGKGGGDKGGSRGRSRSPLHRPAGGQQKHTRKFDAVPAQDRRWESHWWTKAGNRNVCKDYQFRACAHVGPCPNGDKHVCAACGKGAHGAVDCQ